MTFKIWTITKYSNKSLNKKEIQNEKERKKVDFHSFLKS